MHFSNNQATEKDDHPDAGPLYDTAAADDKEIYTVCANIITYSVLKFAVSSTSSALKCSSHSTHHSPWRQVPKFW